MTKLHRQLPGVKTPNSPSARVGYLMLAGKEHLSLVLVTIVYEDMSRVDQSVNIMYSSSSLG